MKKLVYIMAVALGLGSCTQEDIVDNNYNKNSVVYAETPQSEEIQAARTVLDGFKATWRKGDKFTAFSSDSSIIGSYYQVDNSGVGQSAASFTYKGKDKNPTPKYAIYSYYLYPKYDSGSKCFKVAMKESKPLTNNKGDLVDPQFMPSDAPMFGVFKDNVVSFKYATAMLKIDLSKVPAETLETITSVKIKSVDYSLSGNTTMDFNGVVAQISKKGDNYFEILKKYITDNIYYVAIPAGLYPSLYITATKSDEAGGGSYSLGTYNNVKFELGQMYTLEKSKL